MIYVAPYKTRRLALVVGLGLGLVLVLVVSTKYKQYFDLYKIVYTSIIVYLLLVAT